MLHFARLFDSIDRTTSTNAKVSAMAGYFGEAPAADAAWAVFFLTGRRLKRLVPYAAIHDWTLAATGLPSWIVEECYSVVGDGAETAALVLDQLPQVGDRGLGTGDAGLGTRYSGPGTGDSGRADAEAFPLARWVDERIITLRGMDPDAQRERVTRWWAPLDRLQRFVLLKMVTGELRVGVAQTLVVRALAQASGLPVSTVAARLMGDWTPSGEWFTALLAGDSTDADLSRPYPFFLASPLEEDPATLGDPSAWVLEWKWDGIRAQLVRRGGVVHLWSRGEELITRRFPEIAAAATHLPDGTVLDGEVLAFRDGRPLPFSALQQRIGRQKQVAQMARTVPVVFMAYDILEANGRDIRDRPLTERRERLLQLLDRQAPAGETPGQGGVLRISPAVTTASWSDLAAQRLESRNRGVEGLMLKRGTSAYGVGRRRGEWWKWKIDPYT
ncbi:MAG: ATP-dependent DNA ligase, partial [Vicinamibacterales bacterium]